ncbi:hypothetical protein CCH79_00013293 [Gambusia affinis]|uniref:Sin3 histone deacetylase corepressor complex component SDS3 n=2 Tax=Poeciliinae TaxID=586240 RepID=A0A315V2Z2_GAMAF|nr:hypothetical protein CCH79_00013293 [Gambusia affinis]
MASTLISPMVDYYNDEEELDSVDDDDDRSFRGRDSEEDTEDASETDLAKHDEEDYVEIKEQMYQDKLASLKRQLQQLQEGSLQEYQKRMKKLDQQYKERLRNAGRNTMLFDVDASKFRAELFLHLETEQVERNYIKEKKAAVKEFDDKKVELKENLIAELEEKKKMIENEKLTMELTGDSMEVKPIMTRKLRRRPNDPVPIPDKRRKPAPDILPMNSLKSPKRPVSPSSPEHVPSAPMENPTQRYEARIEEGKLYYDKRCSVGTNEIWVRKTSDSTKMRIYLGQLQRGTFVIRRRLMELRRKFKLGDSTSFTTSSPRLASANPERSSTPLQPIVVQGHLQEFKLPWGLPARQPCYDPPPPHLHLHHEGHTLGSSVFSHLQAPLHHQIRSRGEDYPSSPSRPSAHGDPRLVVFCRASGTMHCGGSGRGEKRVEHYGLVSSSSGHWGEAGCTLNSGGCSRCALSARRGCFTLCKASDWGNRKKLPGLPDPDPIPNRAADVTEKERRREKHNLPPTPSRLQEQYPAFSWRGLQLNWRADRRADTLTRCSEEERKAARCTLLALIQYLDSSRATTGESV